MASNLKINYIEFPAKDLDAVKKFYADTFGWTFQDYGPEYCAFNDGQFDGGFFKADARSSQAEGATLVVLFADDLEAALEKVTANNGTIIREIFTFPGGRRFHFTDPNGNELAIWSDK